MEAIADLSRSSTSTAITKTPDDRQSSISLVIPAYNEEAGIADSIHAADRALASLTSDYEIIVVDDGSRDATAARARAAAQGAPAVKVISYAQNRGYGHALRVGFRAASKSLVGFTDADGQFDLTELDRLISLAAKYDIVCGYRIDRQDPRLRRFVSRVYNTGIGLLLGLRVRDCDCALKLFRRESLAKLDLHSDGFFINTELLTRARQAGLSIVEVGVTHRPRVAGRSTVNWRHVPLVLAEVLRFWWNDVLFSRRATATDEPAAPPQSPSSERLWRWAGLGLAVAVVVMFFCQLSYRLIDPDESRYALIAREMLETGNWLVPMRAGEPYLDKPPLLYWLTAAAFWAAGPTDAMARLVPALSAAGTCLVTYMLGRRLVGNRAALVGTALLLLSVGFVMAGRFLLMDGLLTLFVMTSVPSLYIATSGDRVRWSWWLAGAAACGLAVLTKGPVGVVLCVPPLIASQWLTRQNTARLRAFHWATFASVVAAIALPWFVIVSARHPEFMSYFLWQHHVMRFMGSFHHEQSWWFYIPTIIIWMAPASLLMPFLVVFLFRRSESLYQARTQADGYLLLSAAWTLVFFSLSSGKLIAYVLPAVPPLCLLLGRMLAAAILSEQPVRDRLFLRTREAIAFHGARLGAIALAGTAMLNLIAGHSGYLGGESPWGQLGNGLLIVVAAVGFALVTVSTVGRREARLTLAAALFMLAIMSGIVDLVPKVAQRRSLAAQVAAVRANVAPTAPVVTFPRQEDGLEFYHTGGRLVAFEIQDYCQLVGFLERNREALIVATSEGAELLEDRLPSWVRIVEADGRGRIYLATVDKPAMHTANQNSDSTQR